jgi:hypothetical protein
MKNVIVKTNNPEVFYNMIIPEDYVKISLPYFKEWTEALDSGSYSQTKGQLCKTIVSSEGEICSYCCLGILSKVQNRLKLDGSDDGASAYYLSSSNPNFNVIGNMGRFPTRITFKLSEFITNIESLSHLNDVGVPFSEISKVIKEIWKEESLDNVQ